MTTEVSCSLTMLSCSVIGPHLFNKAKSEFRDSTDSELLPFPWGAQRRISILLLHSGFVWLSCSSVNRINHLGLTYTSRFVLIRNHQRLHQAGPKISVLPSVHFLRGRAEDHVRHKEGMTLMNLLLCHLGNAPATFWTLMKKLFHPYLNKWVVIPIIRSIALSASRLIFYSIYTS